MIRIGIIGCGKIVEVGHTPAFIQLKDKVTVVAIADAVPARLTIIGDLLGVPEENRYTDYADLLRNDDVQIVDLALPHFLHEKVAVDCAQAGVDIISEKPLAPTLDAADNILSAVRENKVRLGVLHNYLYRPLFCKALELIRSGTIGAPFLFRSEQLGAGRYQSAKEYDPGWRMSAARGGAGCLLDNGYHNIYLAEAMLGSPVARVFACTNTCLPEIDVEDTSLVLMQHANGSSSSIQNSWSVKAPSPWIFEVHGTEGSIAFDGEKKKLGLYRHSTSEWEYPELGNDSGVASFPPIFRDFLDAYEDGHEFPINGQQARKNLEVIASAYRSARSGQSVEVCRIAKAALGDKE